jgi:hypothetical protein
VQRPAKSWSGDWLESSNLSTSANRGIAQMVERRLPVSVVGGSTPSAPGK